MGTLLNNISITLKFYNMNQEDINIVKFIGIFEIFSYYLITISIYKHMIWL